MARKTTEERLAKIRERKKQIKNEEKLLIQKHKTEERKVRTRRLIERGAILESLIENATELTNDQITTILKRTVGSSYGEKIIAEVKSKTEKSVIVQTAETPILNDETATSQIEITDGSGGNVSALQAENVDTQGV